MYVYSYSNQAYLFFYSDCCIVFISLYDNVKYIKLYSSVFKYQRLIYTNIIIFHDFINYILCIDILRISKRFDIIIIAMV